MIEQNLIVFEVLCALLFDIDCSISKYLIKRKKTTQFSLEFGLLSSLVCVTDVLRWLTNFYVIFERRRNSVSILSVAYASNRDQVMTSH